MDPVKARTSNPVKAPEATKRTDQQSRPETKPDPVVAKKAPDQAPRPTTNTRGESLGRLLNVSA
jgi:hypothetical protein